MFAGSGGAIAAGLGAVQGNRSLRSLHQRRLRRHCCGSACEAHRGQLSAAATTAPAEESTASTDPSTSSWQRADEVEDNDNDEEVDDDDGVEPAAVERVE